MGAYWWNHPRYDGVRFEGGGRAERVAVGEVIEALRGRDLRALRRLDQEAAAYRDPGLGERGARWLLANFGGKLDGPVTVAYTPSAVSSLELLACVTFQRNTRLLVRGLRGPEGGSYRILMGEYPIDLDLVAQGAPGSFCNGQ